MERQVLVFIGVIAVALVAAYAAVSAELSATWLVSIIVFLLLVVTFCPRIHEFKEYERGVLFLLGRFDRLVMPGWHLLVPHVQSVVKVDLRTQVVDLTPQEVITQDNIRLKVDAVIYLRVVDAKKAIVEVEDYKAAVRNLLYAEIRNMAGKMSLEEVLERTEEIGLDLYATVKRVESDWGISAQQVKIKSIELPEGLAVAFRRRREAKEYKRKLETEAEARQLSIDIIDRAASKMSDRTMAYLYLDVLKKVADGKSTKIIFPLELSRLASLLSGKITGSKEEKQKSYDDIADALVKAYTEQQRGVIDAQTKEAEEATEEEAGEGAAGEEQEEKQPKPVAKPKPRKAKKRKTRKTK